MDDIWPKHYVKLPFPALDAKNSWHGVVADRARIVDPDFHGGKTEAIRLLDPSKDERDPKLPWFRKPGRGEWIEFRNFKEANAFVQAYKRLGK